MSATTILHVAAALALIQYGAHLFYLPRQSHGTFARRSLSCRGGEVGHFRFGIRPNTYWDMYFGYGLLVILAGLAEVCFLWLIASMAASGVAAVKPMMGVLLLFNILHAGLAWKFFSLPIPVVFDGLIAGCLAWALLVL